MALDAAMQKAKLRGVTFEHDAIRTYPNGESLGHVLGFLDHEGKAFKESS